MAVAIMIIGIGAGMTLSIGAWIAGAPLLLAVLAYPVGGTLACLLAGVGIALCRARSESEGLSQLRS